MGKRDIKAKRWLKRRLRREQGYMWRVAVELTFAHWGWRAAAAIDGFSYQKNGRLVRFTPQPNPYIR